MSVRSPRSLITDGGDAAYLSTLPLDAIQNRLLAAGIPCQLSGTAGAFLCNALMYHDAPPCRRQLGMVFQQYANVAYGLRRLGGSSSDIEARVAELLRLVDEQFISATAILPDDIAVGAPVIVGVDASDLMLSERD